MGKHLLAPPLFAQLEESADAVDEGSASNPEIGEIDLNAVPTDLQGAMETVTRSLAEMWTDFLARLPLIAVGLVILAITWGVAKIASGIIRRSLTRARLRRSLRDLIRQIIYCVIWVAGLLVAAVVVFPGMTPAKVLTVLGLGSIAIGFAFKDIVENFFAGILILWRFPFEPGDFIECNSIIGQVEDTTIRMTTLRQVDGQLVVLPNAQLFKSPVYVITSQARRRTTLICGVDYGTDLEKAKQVLTEALSQCQSVAPEKPVEIFGQEFAGSSINFEVTWWTGSTPLEIRQSRDEVVRAVKAALDQADITIPFPHRTLTFKEPLAFDTAKDGSLEELASSVATSAKLPR